MSVTSVSIAASTNAAVDTTAYSSAPNQPSPKVPNVDITGIQANSRGAEDTYRSGGSNFGASLPPANATTLNTSGSFGAPLNQSKKRFPPPPPPFGSTNDRQLNKLTNMAQYTPGKF